MTATAEPAVTAAAPRGGVWRSVGTGVTTVLLLGLLVLALAVAVVPRLMGGSALTVLTGSMEPTHAPGDMVVAVPQESYQVGDVVTFQPVSDDPTLITHRIVGTQVGADGTRYVTRGDANGADDDPIQGEQIMGEVVYAVPYVGHLSNAVGNHRPAVVAGVAIILLGYSAYAITSAAIGRRRNSTSQYEGVST
ncbi:signal peptidase I [Ruania suaedae]|uniref:signal peptidase I n=1 Tax=Ruania suaedae TaxID=2897774 RepID=UPI001E5AAFB4|nr:signal peptidase I [Ruania suaedae]UFU03294.1 signal peptidase I [Ruania suaedae]